MSRFDDSVVPEDKKIIRDVMEYIEENTCVIFIETKRPRYKYLTISTDKSYNCIYCYYLGLVCPLRNGGSVRSSPFCTKSFNCPYYYGSVEMSLKFTLPFCGRLEHVLIFLVVLIFLQIFQHLPIDQIMIMNEYFTATNVSA